MFSQLPSIQNVTVLAERQKSCQKRLTSNDHVISFIASFSSFGADNQAMWTFTRAPAICVWHRSKIVSILQKRKTIVNSVILVLTSLWVVKVEVLLDYYRDVWILVNEVVNETLRQNLTINLTTREILLLNANYFFLTVSSTWFHKLTVTSFFFRSFKLFLSFEKNSSKNDSIFIEHLGKFKKTCLPVVFLYNHTFPEEPRKRKKHFNYLRS